MAAIVRFAQGVDPRAALRIAMNAGPLAPVALLPFLAATTFDAMAMQLLLRSIRECPSPVAQPCVVGGPRCATA